jgi:hypothetical protein
MLYPLSKIPGVEAVAEHRMNKGSSNENDHQKRGDDGRIERLLSFWTMTPDLLYGPD